jgi:hypothetical protein
MFMNSKNVWKFVKVFTNLKNVHDSKYVHELKKGSWFHEIESDSVSWWCSKMWSWSLEIMIFFLPLQRTGLFASMYKIFVAQNQGMATAIPCPLEASASSYPFVGTCCNHNPSLARSRWTWQLAEPIRRSQLVGRPSSRLQSRNRRSLPWRHVDTQPVAPCMNACIARTRAVSKLTNGARPTTQYS